MKRLLLRTAGISVGLLLVVFAGVALASGEYPVREHLGFVPSIQTWALILGAITPLATYVINHYAPWADEKVKAVALGVIAGVVGAVYTAIETSTFGWNDATLQAILTAIIAAFGAHALVYRPSGINVALGGGSNHNGVPNERELAGEPPGYRGGE